MEHSIAAKYAARPAARFRPPLDPRPRAPPRASRPSGAFQSRPRAPDDGPARPRDRAAGPLRAAMARRSSRDGPATRRAGARGRLALDAVGQVRARRRRPTPGRRVGAVARLRTATATSAGGIVVRSRAGPALARRRQPSPRARRPDLDPAQGHARTRRDARGDRPPRGHRGDRARGPDHRAARLDRVLVRPVRDAHPQDRPLLPDGADRRRPGARTTTSSTRSAGSRSTRPAPLLTFETERALVARAAADTRLDGGAGASASVGEPIAEDGAVTETSEPAVHQTAADRRRTARSAPGSSSSAAG